MPMPKKIGNQEKNKYTKLLVLKSRRHKIALSILLLVACYMLVLTSFGSLSWPVLAIPVIGMGLLTLLVPQSEQWEYKYWQDRPERHEKISFEYRQKDL
jgi:predicted MFS family arabinose efflux permease